MKKKTVSLCAFFILTFSKLAFSQLGTLASPFTSVAQAMAVNSAGIYYFNIAGNTFSTQVSAYGWILLASDVGGSSASSLPLVTSLTPTSRGILGSAVLNNLLGITAVGISSSDGNIDVTTTNAFVIARVNSFKTIDQGLGDNLLYGSPWTGTGAANLNSQLSYCADISTLDAVIYHPCGDGSKFHWLPNTAQLAEVWSNGFISNSVYFNLWVQSSLTVTPLPIELLNFNAAYNPSNDKVDVSWATSVETDNNYFTVEKSRDGQNFSELSIVKTKAINGNSQSKLSYQTTDENPVAGNMYYRLKQTDFNGNYKYFNAIEVNTADDNQDVIMFPNPLTDKTDLSIHLIGYKNEVIVFEIRDITGRLFLTKTLQADQNNQTFIVDELKNLLPGTYIAGVSSSGKANTYKMILR